MSRSYKKHPVAKLRNDKAMKKIFARRVRRSKDPDAYKNYKKMNSSYEICDYRVLADNKDVDKMDWDLKKQYKRK